MWFIIFIICLILYLYTFGLSTYKRVLSPEVLRRGSRKKNQVAITFDDGPNPMYTPLILDLLKRYSVPASFFIVAKNAEKYPEIIKRMSHEGHLIGLHSSTHKHAWLMSPWETYQDFIRSIRIYERILGKSPQWYRPPWGTFNGFSHFFANHFHLKTAYWSIEAQDWKKDMLPSTISDIVIRKVEAGSIIVLHDNNGAPEAPLRTIESLPAIFESLRSKGFVFITLDNMEGE